MPTYRSNVTNKEQDVLENAEFEAGVPVFDDGKTRVISKARGGAQRVAHGATRASNAGVVMPDSDKPGAFVQPGHAGTRFHKV